MGFRLVGWYICPSPPFSFHFSIHFAFFPKIFKSIQKNSLNNPMEFARRRPMLSAPFGALLGAVVAVAVLLPSHCNAIECMEGGTDDDKSLKEIVSNCSYREEKVKENGPIVCAALVCVLEKEKHVLYRQNCKNENSNTQKDCQGYGKNVAKKALGKGDWKCKCAKSKVNQGKDIDLSALGLPSKYYPSWYSFAAHLRVSQLLLIVALLVPLAIVHVMTTTLFNGH